MFRGRKEEQEFTEEENKSNPLRELAGIWLLYTSEVVGKILKAAGVEK